MSVITIIMHLFTVLKITSRSIRSAYCATNGKKLLNSKLTCSYASL